MMYERIVSAFITNLGKYTEGELVGEWVEFPIDEKEEDAIMYRIGIGECDEFGQPYEEIFFTDYEDNGIDLYRLFGEYPMIEDLNKLGEKVQSLTDQEYSLMCAVIDDNGINTLQEILDFDPNKYCFWEGKDKTDVAELEIDEIYPNLPDAIKNCIDYERYADEYMWDYVETQFGTYLEY